MDTSSGFFTFLSIRREYKKRPKYAPSSVHASLACLWGLTDSERLCRGLAGLPGASGWSTPTDPTNELDFYLVDALNGLYWRYQQPRMVGLAAFGCVRTLETRGRGASLGAATGMAEGGGAGPGSKT